MAAPSNVREQTVLRLSMLVTLLLAVIGVVWGLLAGAQVILFDGIYALLGVLLTGVSLAAARVSRLRPSARFPFGLEAVVPLAVGLQGAALLGTVAFASVEAVRIILEGGSEVAADAVAAYGALTTLVCFLTWGWIRRGAPGSDLLAAEAQAWWASALLSVVVLVGAMTALALRALGVRGIEQFVDPVLVLVACALLLPTPLGMLRGTLVELLEGAPSAEVMDRVTGAIARVRAAHGLPEPVLRVSKLGRKLYIEADFVVDDSWDVAGEDDVRRAVADAVRDLPFDVWLNVELTTDPALIA